MNSSLDIREVFELFGERLKAVIPFDRISITVPDTLSNTYVTTYSNGIVVRGRQMGQSYSLSGSATEKVLNTRKGLIINTDEEGDLEASLPGLIHMFRQGIHSFLTVPLISKGEVVAVFNMHARESGSFDEYDLALAERIGSQIAGAIANSQLHASLERDAEERKIVAEIGKIVSSSLDIDDFHGVFADHVHKLIKFDRMDVNLINVEAGESFQVFSTGKQVSGWQNRVSDSVRKR